MQKLLFGLRIPLIIIGLVLFFVAERYLAAESYHLGLRWGGFALVGVAWLSGLALLLKAQGEGRPAEAKALTTTLLWQLGVLAGLGLYLAYRSVLGDQLVPEQPLSKVLLGAWVLVLALSLLAGVGIEWAMRDHGLGVHAEPQHVARSGASWLLVGMLLSFLVAINYVGEKKNITRDLSYLKVTSPSPSTLGMVKSLTQDIQVAVFFPQGNDVRAFVAQYLDQLAKSEPKLKLAYYDRELDPTKAEEYRVARNGQIVLDYNGKKARLDTGTNLTKARKTLRSFDAEFQKTFLEVTALRKTLYFTRGHGEPSWIGQGSEDPLKSLGLLEGMMRGQSYSLKLFGVGEGSATAVPDDAALVVVVGPTSPFQKEEVEALRSYLDRGGKLLVLLDIAKKTGDAATAPAAPEDDPLRQLLSEIGVTFQDIPLGNDKNFVAATRSPADAWFLFSNSFTSHESVASLARNDERLAVLFFQTGALKIKADSGKWKAYESIRSLTDTFADINRDFKYTAGSEKREAYVLAAVAESKEGKKGKDEGGKAQEQKARVAVIADATLASDALIRNPGNALFIADSIKWLAGDVERTGEVASEEDIKIRHTRKEDVLWFYATVALVPLLVLGGGFVATRRRARERTGTAQEKPDAA